MPAGMALTAFDLASRYIGIREIGGEKDHPLIQWWLSLCSFSTEVHDEVPWCSAFTNGIAWELRLPRSKSARARSWLNCGRAIGLHEAQVGWDIVILNRGGTMDASIIEAPGHVGFFAGPRMLLAGNQGNAVSVAPFDPTLVLGVRRLLG